MIEEDQNVSEVETSDVRSQLTNAECQTEMVKIVETQFQTDSQRIENIECQTVPVLMVDKECQTEDVVIVSAHNLQTLPFEQPDMSDDKKVKYYTGITNLPTLLLLLKFSLPEMKSVERSLTNFQQIVITLMKLRLNLEETNLAYRFNVSQSTISRTFKKWISYMGHKLSPLIRWPC